MRPAPYTESAPADPRSTAVEASADRSDATPSPGNALSRRAAAPETLGAAKEVPEFVV